MSATNKVFGITVDTRKKRRRLVVATYCVLMLIGSLATLAGNGIAVWGTIYAITFANAFVFGGYTSFGRSGLVKPFLNKPPREESVQSELIKLHLEDATHVRFRPSSADEAWKNDERELRRRDNAHYRAYPPLAIAVMFLFLIAAWSLHRPHWLPVNAMAIMLYAIALPAMLLALTLPQAIILWTEPDIDDSDAIAPAGAYSER